VDEGWTDFRAGRLEDALVNWRTAIGLNPDDPALREAIRRALEEARKAALEARTAGEAGAAARDAPQYGAARERFQEADRQAASNDPAEWLRALRGFIDARDLFDQAAAQARAAAQKVPPPVDHRAEILSVLAQYERALESLDEAPVRRLFPKVDPTTLRGLDDYRTLDVTFTNITVVLVSPERAAIRCVMDRKGETRQRGQRDTPTVDVDMAMVRANGRWVIDAFTARGR
jgi:tetratricopeptide (TPR) repeat protein